MSQTGHVWKGTGLHHFSHLKTLLPSPFPVIHMPEWKPISYGSHLWLLRSLLCSLLAVMPASVPECFWTHHSSLPQCCSTLPADFSEKEKVPLLRLIHFYWFASQCISHHAHVTSCFQPSVAPWISSSSPCEILGAWRTSPISTFPTSASTVLLSFYLLTTQSSSLFFSTQGPCAYYSHCLERCFSFVI